MSDDPSWLDRFKRLPKDLLTNRFILLLIGALFLAEGYNSGLIPALLTREEGIVRTAEADAAKLRQESEANLAQQKGLTETIRSDYAPRKEKAEARKAEAAAALSAAQVEITDAEAAYADALRAAEADARTGLAELTRQQALVEEETARQASRLLRAQAESEQIGVAIKRIDNLLYRNMIEVCSDCDPTYCILCGQKRYVPDLPSGAMLPPAVEGETPLPATPAPTLKLFVSRFPFQAGSECDRMYKTWSATLAFGAFATGRRRCGYSAGEPSPTTARNQAINDCADSCEVIAEITHNALPKPKVTGTPVLTRIEGDQIPFTNACRRAFEDWRGTGLYGAAAVGSLHCAFSRDEEDLETAKRHALMKCGDRDCAVAYVITIGPPPASTPVKSTPSAPATPPAQMRGLVVPIQLNVHSAPNPNADSVIGKLNRGQTVIITGASTVGDFIAVEGTCEDGKPCRGYVNGRPEFISRQR